MRRLASFLAPALVAASAITAMGLPTPADAAPAPAASPEPRSAARIVAAPVTFDVVNSNSSSATCRSDNESYTLGGTLIGPRRQILHGTLDRVNVVVHGLSTGSWLWHLTERSGVDYATQLAHRGETTLVLDRLGYGRSKLTDPRATCLGAQATMLHQVVQKLKAGSYSLTGGNPQRHVPHAAHVVLHGHAVGAAIAEVEAASFDDVTGVVVMSWADEQPSDRALEVASGQQRSCMRAERAAYGSSNADFRSLLFRTAYAGVQRSAVARRVAAPCGDVTSLAALSIAARNSVADIDVPVLLLHGSKDALVSSGAAQAQRGRYGAGSTVTYRELVGAGSALTLERAAPVVRREVLTWLHRSFDR